MTHSTFTLIRHQFSQPCSGFHLGQEGASDLSTNSLNYQRKVKIHDDVGLGSLETGSEMETGGRLWERGPWTTSCGERREEGGTGWAEVVCDAVVARTWLIPGGALELRCPLQVSCTETRGACHCTLALLGYE